MLGRKRFTTFNERKFKNLEVLAYNQLYITVFKICGWLPVVGASEESNPSVPGHVRLTLKDVQMWKMPLLETVFLNF
jgi:hypothetical protein